MHYAESCCLLQSPAKAGKSFVKAGLFSKTLEQVDKPQMEIFTVNRKKRFSWLPVSEKSCRNITLGQS